MADDREKEPRNRDEKVNIPLDPEEALRGLVQVDPESEPTASAPAPAKGSKPRQSQD